VDADARLLNGEIRFQPKEPFSVRVLNRRVLVALGLGVATSLPVAIAAAPAASASAACQPKLFKLKGQPVTAACGPATAKLHFKGKSYSFKAGTCTSVVSAGQKGGTLNLGKNVDVPRNLGLVGMQIAFTGNPTGSVLLIANVGKVYINDGAATATPKFGSRGTIKGTSDGVPYTVSWNCGGAIAKN
jgi:hypothetical protein